MVDLFRFHVHLEGCVAVKFGFRIMYIFLLVFIGYRFVTQHDRLIFGNRVCCIYERKVHDLLNTTSVLINELLLCIFWLTDCILRSCNNQNMIQFDRSHFIFARTHWKYMSILTNIATLSDRTRSC